MSNDRVRGTPLINQVLAVLLGAMLLYLVVSFIHQVKVSRQQLENLDRIEQSIAVELEESKELERLREYVESDRVIDWWARSNGWGKQDEVVVATVGDSTEPLSPEAQASPEESVSADAPGDAWWDLFFGTR
jgi:hypothetical protein